MSKNKKKRIVAVFALALLCCVCFTLAACDIENSLQKQINDLQDKLNGYEANNLLKTVTLYVGDTPYGISTRENKVFDALEVLQSEKGVTFSHSGSKYSAYVTRLGDLIPNPASEYISVYHTIDDSALQGTDASYHPMTKERFGKTFYYSNVGISLLPLEDGASYWFELTSFV